MKKQSLDAIITFTIYQKIFSNNTTRLIHRITTAAANFSFLYLPVYIVLLITRAIHYWLFYLIMILTIKKSYLHLILTRICILLT